MAKVFLDTNIIIDILSERNEVRFAWLDSDEIYLSPLSLHIFFYVERKKIPYTPISTFLANANIIDFTDSVSQKAIVGPTSDFEDNVQLHSASEAQCDLFLTSDKDLLVMKFFGKAQIISPENLK